MCLPECPPVSLPRLARRRAPQEEAILRRPPRAINLYRALLVWQSEQTFAKPWTLLMPRSAPLSVKPPTAEMGMKAGGKVKKMQAGGKCRGMGAATRGGNFSRG
jgi:hypothetical protein